MIIEFDDKYDRDRINEIMCISSFSLCDCNHCSPSFDEIIEENSERKDL